MGRRSISLSADHEEIIKQMNNDNDDDENFFKLYRQVLNWDYNIKEATFKRILSALLKNNEQEPSSIEKNKNPDMFKLYPDAVPNNRSSQEKNANKKNIDNNLDIKKDKSVDAKINTQNNNESPVNKEEKDDSNNHPYSDTNNNVEITDPNNKENVKNSNTLKVDDLKSQNIPNKDMDTPEYSSSTQENTHLPSNINISPTDSQSIQEIEDLSKKIDSLTNAIHSILKKIDYMNGAILNLEQKNPNKIIKQNADDFIRIYADERKSTSINLNIQLKEHIQNFGKKFNVKTFSDAVNLALLTTLYTYDDSEITKEK